MPEAIRDLLQLAEWAAPGISDQTLREVERTVLEITYAGTLSLAYYLDDPDTSEVSWSRPATAIEYMAGWDWIENCHDFDRPPEPGSWIEYPSRHEHALALLTSHGVGKPGGFIAWTRKEGTYSSLLPRHVIDELERLSETEIQRSLNALYAPLIFGGDDGLRFDGGTIRQQVFALFVDQDAHRACYPIHAELITDDKADLALPSARKAIIRSILLPLKKAIQARGGFADPESISLLADFHLRVAPFDASRIPEIIQSFAAAIQGKGHILEFACINVSQAASETELKPPVTEERKATVPDELVTLDQAAAVVGQSKRTLERYLQRGDLPRPDLPGGGGKAHRWFWGTLRPALEKHFRPDLPAKFPASRVV